MQGNARFGELGANLVVAAPAPWGKVRRGEDLRGASLAGHLGQRTARGPLADNEPTIERDIQCVQRPSKVFGPRRSHAGQQVGIEDEHGRDVTVASRGGRE